MNCPKLASVALALVLHLAPGLTFALALQIAYAAYGRDALARVISHLISRPDR